MSRPPVSSVLVRLNLLLYLAFPLFAPAALAAGPASTSPAAEIVATRGSFTSQGKPILVERFEPKAPGKHPAVLVLHGAEGMTLGGNFYRENARALARAGYVAHFVHYFDATGTRLADKATMKSQFATWMKTIAEAVTNVTKQPNVDPDRIGLVGYSLGSYLSLSLAIFDARINAVVEYSGGLPAPLFDLVTTLPPTLMLHGDIDRVVPVSEAKSLRLLFESKKFTHEVQIYPDQGHGFFGSAHADATRRCVAFLDLYVKTPPSGPRRSVSTVPLPEVYPAFLKAAG